MGEATKISWANSSCNFWWGCEKVSPACRSCYAESMSKRVGEDIWGHDKPRKLIKSAEALIRKLNEKAGKTGQRHLVFVNSMSDFFEEDTGQLIVDHQGQRLYRLNGMSVTTEQIEPYGGRRHPLSLAELRNRAFELFDCCSNLTFLLLTKRPENIERMWPRMKMSSSTWDTRHKGTTLSYRRNVWVGTTAENQEWADKRIAELLKCRDLSPVLFLSCEPLLSSLDLRSLLCVETGRDGMWRPKTKFGFAPKVDWVIGGSESGSGRRPSEQSWFESLAQQCKAAGVPYFHKQMEVNGRVTDDPSQFPESLRVQEFPKI